MARRLRLTVAYDGTPFAGWQSQTHSNTIQDHLESVLARVTGQHIRVHGAGRTDAGVHALAQCAHVDLAQDCLSAQRWSRALNALLPPAIRVLRCRYVSNKFHARFSAKRKVYRYRLWIGPVLPPFEYKRAWHIPALLDLKLLKAAANEFTGRHDFAGFAANRGKAENNTMRTIYSVKVQQRGSCVTIDFDGDGFLYRMVRLMVGSIVECARNKLSIDQISRQLDSRGNISKRLAAPAEGLFLIRIRY